MTSANCGPQVVQIDIGGDGFIGSNDMEIQMIKLISTLSDLNCQAL